MVVVGVGPRSPFQDFRVLIGFQLSSLLCLFLILNQQRFKIYSKNIFVFSHFLL